MKPKKAAKSYFHKMWVDRFPLSVPAIFVFKENQNGNNDRLVVDFIDQMLNIFVWDDFGSIKLSTWLFGVEQFWLDFGIRAQWKNLEH